MWLLYTFLLYLLIIGIVESTVDFLQHPVKSCHVGDAVENACNKCLCTSKTVFECTPLGCNKKITDNELDESEPSCVPNQLYVQNLITCICTKDGRWPHKSCKDTFQSLPPRNVITHTCEPDTYIPVDCNVCRCGPDGKILNDRCTRNVCEDDLHRRTNSPNTVFSKCEDKYWYSLAPCQFCFCVNQNKLVCNTGNYYTRNLDLGSYKLNVCGKDLIKEAIELIPDNVKTLRATSEVANKSINQIPESLPNLKQNNDPPKAHHNLNIAFEYVPENDEKKVNEHFEIKVLDGSVTQQPTLKPVGATTIRTKEIQVARIPLRNQREKAGVSYINIEEDDDDDSIGIAIDFDPTLTTEASLQANIDAKEVKHSYEDEGKTLKINIPKALNKVFKMAVRKSMVTLSKKTKCTPGATTVHGCNMCFCLKNYKKLCTSHKCIGGKKA